jgi:palmitoyl-protein thioesterase
MFSANCFFVVLFCVHEAITTTPVVLWHGVGSDHLDSIKQIIKENVDEDVYIKSIQLGMNAVEDTENGILIHPNDQISEVCYEIMGDENLKGGFHAIGFSQGAQFL